MRTGGTKDVQRESGNGEIPASDDPPDHRGAESTKPRGGGGLYVIAALMHKT